MEHAIHRVTSVEVVGPRTLRIGFDDGICRTIDFGPVLFGKLYAPLKEDRVFREVRIDPEVHTLVWPNGADFDPATLHDWPEVAEDFAAMARDWDAASNAADERAP